MSSVEEKKLLKDIDFLKKALPDMQKLSQITPKLNEIKEERKKITADLDVVKKLIDDKEDKIHDVRQAS
jgi:uncharacterized coiled-coil DUF342 family protein